MKLAMSVQAASCMGLNSVPNRLDSMLPLARQPGTDDCALQALCLLFADLQAYGSTLVSPRRSPMKRTVSSGPPQARREHRLALEKLVADTIQSVERQVHPWLCPCVADIASAGLVAGADSRGLQASSMPSLERLDRLAGELEAAAPDLQQVHLLRHTVALHQNDHTTAVEALHRYFDYRPASRTRASLLDIAVSTLLPTSTDTRQLSSYKGFAHYTKFAYRRSCVTA